jgi:hypothetical protein
LEDFAARFDDLFGTLARRRRFRTYLQGLLAPQERTRTLTALVGAKPLVGAQHPEVQRPWFFLPEAPWEAEAVDARRLELLLADPATATFSREARCQSLSDCRYADVHSDCGGKPARRLPASLRAYDRGHTTTSMSRTCPTTSGRVPTGRGGGRLCSGTTAMGPPLDWSRPWLHGSPYELAELLPGSTITQDPVLAEAFSHKPSFVSDARHQPAGALPHKGRQPGWLHVVDEALGESDVTPVPGSTIGRPPFAQHRQHLPPLLLGRHHPVPPGPHPRLLRPQAVGGGPRYHDRRLPGGGPPAYRPRDAPKEAKHGS